MADLDTKIDASPEDITSAANWLGKLKTGFDDAHTSTVNTASERAEISGDFGRALNEYVNDLASGCSSASSELKTTIDVINSWHDQVVWRKQDMAGYRDDATTGGLTVQDDRYIKAPDPVSDPGKLSSKASASEKSTWQTNHDNYEEYLKKRNLFNTLSSKASETHKKLTDWVNEHMKVSDKSPVYELVSSSLKNGAIKFAEHRTTNTYHGLAYYALLKTGTPAATKRYQVKSPSPKRRNGQWEPKQEPVAKRAEASAKYKVSTPEFASKAAKYGKRVGVIGTLALSGYEIYQGKSPSQVGVETAAGFAGGALGATAATMAIGAAAAAGVTVAAPALITGFAAVAAGSLIAMGAGKLYESAVPLRTRERIDEGIKDVWNATAGSAWKSIFE